MVRPYRDVIVVTNTAIRRANKALSIKYKSIKYKKPTKNITK